MFTGLIAEIAEVVSLKKQAGGATLTIKAGGTASFTGGGTASFTGGGTASFTGGGSACCDSARSDSASTGDSIALNGACLTVTEVNDRNLSFDLSDETLMSTTLGSLRAGDRVNLEPSLRADGKLGGHFVAGHVDAVGKIKSKNRHGGTFKVEIEAPPGVMRFLVLKGSVSVDGISLTVVDVLGSSFTVVIIPHTAEATTIGAKGPGDAVNLEADMLGKYVFKFLEGQRQGDEGLMRAMREGGYV